MPQMMPLNWLMLFIYFITTLMLFNTMNYFMMNKFIDFKKLNLNTKITSWKW
uniref:ATP synthase F0 subunit 8 n=1 Tax=Allacta bruna TaxID=3037029 RepID=UPI0027A135D4|nr:ATP synthase F0 subunit 8 [Allacta bruna]WGO57031.1 ATP synthase F0 subunit 8 [Allacta bruna]